MSIAVNLPVLIVQTPLVEAIAAAEQSHLDVQQVQAQLQAASENIKDQEQIQGSEPTETEKLQVREDGGNKSGRQAMQHRRDKRHAAVEEEEEGAPAAANPWAGNIVDVKI